MERKIRRVDRAIPEREAIEILREGEYGILSTVSLDGQPYGVPVSYTYQGDVIYFHCAIEGQYGGYKGRNPRTGEIVDVPPKKLPHFKVGKELKDLFRGRGGLFPSGHG